MGILAVDTIKSRTVAPVTVSDDLNVTGVATCTGAITASGGVVGNLTGNADSATTVSGNINVGIVTATDQLYVGNAGAGTKITGVANSITVDGGASSVNLQFKETSGAYQRMGIVKDNDKLQLGEFNNDGTTFTDIVTVTGAGDKVGVGTDIPEGLLHIEASSSGANYTPDAADTLILERNGGCVIDFRTPAANDAGLIFSDNAARAQGTILYNHSDNSLQVGTAGGERFRVGSAGQWGVGGANYGTSGQVLTSGGASAAPSWADAGGGAWELMTDINMGSDYGSANLDITGFTTAYREYKVNITNLRTVGGNAKDIRVRFWNVDGGTLHASDYNYSGYYHRVDGSASGNLQTSSNSHWSICNGSATTMINCVITIPMQTNAANTWMYANAMGRFQYSVNAGSRHWSDELLEYAGANDKNFTGMRFFNDTDSTNFMQGRIAVYRCKF